MKYGENPARARFYEIKKSKNRDGSPQINVIDIEFTPILINRVLELYRRVVAELAGRPLIDPETDTVRFIPNFDAQFGAKESWDDFCYEVDNGFIWSLKEVIPNRSQNKLAEESFEALDL